MREFFSALQCKHASIKYYIIKIHTFNYITIFSWIIPLYNNRQKEEDSRDLYYSIKNGQKILDKSNREKEKENYYDILKIFRKKKIINITY